MANEIYAGEAYKLVFPLLSNGYLNINYDDTVTVGSTTQAATREGRLWGHEESFTIDTLITPYDVNGYGHRTSGNGILTSEKTPPSPNLSLDNHADTTSNYQSVVYFGANRNTHKMMLFHNTNLKLYLQNTTSSNFNQPAEYKIVAEITDETGSTETITSGDNNANDSTVIKADNKLWGYYDENGFYEGLSTNLTKFATTANYSDIGNKNITVNSNAANGISTGNEIYNTNGKLLGVVNSVSGDVINLVTVSSETQTTNGLLTSQPKEALYLEQMYKISFTYLKGGTMLLYVDNIEVARKKVSLKTVKLHASDCQIGRGSSNAEQFFGELFEICMHEGKEPCEGINSLSPSYPSILFYYAFGV